MFQLKIVLALTMVFVSIFGSAASFAQPSPAPKLVVVLVVDQMRADYVDRYGQQWSRGLKRLVTEGAWFRRSAFPYLNTFTCAGHATVSTGALPARHGMVGNSWYDRAAGASVGCTQDAGVSLVSYAGPAKGGNSASRLLVPTLADELRTQLASPAKVATFSLKERTAITLAGRKADAVTWFDLSARGFVTSSAYTDRPVPFLAEFVKANPVEADFDKAWERLLPEASYLFADGGTGEKPGKYWSREFPHPIRIGDGRNAESYDAWETSPYSDTYLGRLGQATIDALKLGRGPGTDYLGISFSALDLVGHDFGPTSHEVQDLLIRLDGTIGQLLDHLDRQVGKGQYVVALTADHGVAPIPEQVRAMDLDAGRIDTAAVIKAASEALRSSLGYAPPAPRLANSDLYLDPAVVGYLRESPSALGSVLRALRAVPGVANAYFAESLVAHAAAGDTDAQAALASYHPARSGDIIVIAKPYHFYVRDDGTAQPGSATTHGSLYDYDRRVPLVFYGSGIRPGEYLQKATPADIAPTLAFLCGITLPRPDGEVLVDAIAPRVLVPARALRR
ncbi:MAG: alkaline phosphatase family protein [Acidobacteriota bacterium]